MGFQGWNNVVNGGGVSYYPYLQGEDANLLFRFRFALADAHALRRRVAGHRHSVEASRSPSEQPVAR